MNGALTLTAVKRREYSRLLAEYYDGETFANRGRQMPAKNIIVYTAPG